MKGLHSIPRTGEGTLRASTVSTSFELPRCGLLSRASAVSACELKLSSPAGYENDDSTSSESRCTGILSIHGWVVSMFRRVVQSTPLGAASALPMACMLEAVRNRKLTAAEVDALASVTIGQLIALWRVWRYCRKPPCLSQSAACPSCSQSFICKLCLEQWPGASL